jgi:hypothetical protein
LTANIIEVIHQRRRVVVFLEFEALLLPISAKFMNDSPVRPVLKVSLSSIAHV